MKLRFVTNKMKPYLWCYVLLVLVVVCYYTLNKATQSELYNPYEYRSGIYTSNSDKFIQSQRTGWKYLDIYLDQDHYLQNPWVYPTDNSYTMEWYHLRRNEPGTKIALTPYS